METFFITPRAFDASFGGGSPSEYCQSVWYGMAENEKKLDDTFSRFDRIPASDGQTDILRHSRVVNK